MSRIFFSTDTGSIDTTCRFAHNLKAFQKAKINVGDRRHSTHALRMTFASQLIAENVPYEVVRVLLGHVNRDSTRHYVEFSIEGLRSCALEVPAPSGLFAQYMAEEA